MNQGIEELKSITGVMGGYIFHTQKGILANNLPSVFKVQKLTEMGNMLVTMYQTGRMNFSDILEISIYYEESIILIREAASDIYLIVMCDPSLNINLLSISMNMIMGKIEKRSIKSASEVSASQNMPSFPTAKEFMEFGPMAETLKGMQAALTKVMGPMSKIIFMEALEEWLRSDNPSYSTLKTLIRILIMEIQDPKKISHFEKMIAPHIEPGMMK